MLVDKDIKNIISEGVLRDADASRVGPVSYDLQNYAFYREGELLESVGLKPGDSVYVGSAETIALPNDLVAQVTLKNSRIRQGLALAAPIYFPGHHTRVFFRVTNISADEIQLRVGHDIAQLMFSRLDSVPDQPYDGAFAGELEFRGLGIYSDVFEPEMRKIEQKTEQIEAPERRIYGNVIAIMGVFVAVFSLINVDLSWASTQQSMAALVILNLSIVGGMSALVGLIATILGTKGSKALPWVLASVSFATAIALSLLIK